MGTNYYWHNDPPKCPTCGNRNPGTHIGKSSVGWKFAFRANALEGLCSRKDWEAALRTGGLIIDENGRVDTVDEFMAFAKLKQQFKSHEGSEMAVVTQDDEGYDMCWYSFS